MAAKLKKKEEKPTTPALTPHDPPLDPLPSGVEVVLYFFYGRTKNKTKEKRKMKKKEAPRPQLLPPRPPTRPPSPLILKLLFFFKEKQKKTQKKQKKNAGRRFELPRNSSKQKKNEHKNRIFSFFFAGEFIFFKRPSPFFVFF